MPEYTARTHSHPADLQKMIALLEMARPAGRFCDYPAVLDLQELMGLPEVQAQTRLWENPQGDCGAYAIVDPWNNLWFDLKPSILCTPLEAEIVAWGMECVRARIASAQGDAPVTLDTNCPSDNLERLDLLRRNGFEEQALRTIQFVRTLREPVPALELPPGFTLRTAAGEAEAETLAALHRAAFDSDVMTAEYRLSMMHVPDYDSELDLLIIAPHGAPVGFCVCQVEPGTDGKDGSTDPVGVHPQYQRRGLARSLLVEGMRRLQQRGVETVRLSTTSENLAMQKTAQAVGFQVERTKIWFSKPLTTPL